MNPSSPLVSIIIPVYNAEAYLAETLQSVLATTYAPLEVVVVDDGSTDHSLLIAQQYAQQDERLRVFSQSNQGVCRARNHAISQARGTYVLPVDADDLIEPQFVAQAVAAISSDTEVRVVCSRADYFGARTGEWHLPTFSLRELARHNILSICGLYRREDWVRVGGYDETIRAREDWAFWIALLKDGGRVVRLPDALLHYRVHRHSKRIADRTLKAHVVRTLNRLHPEFFEHQLGGPLRLQRSWSRLLNRLYRLTHPRRVVVHADYATLTDFVTTLPARFAYEDGTVIFKNRNEIRAFHHAGQDIIVKEFKIPNLINRIAYGIFRSSKAVRSYHNALTLRQLGIGTPTPIGYVTLRSGLLFARSYYASLRSACPLSYMDVYRLFQQPSSVASLPLSETQVSPPSLPTPDAYLRAIGQLTARLHEQHLFHTDYSRGNLLFGHDPQGNALIELVDLNRIRRRCVDLVSGIRGFERLPLTAQMLPPLIGAYATARGYDYQQCLDTAHRLLPLLPEGELPSA